MYVQSGFLHWMLARPHLTVYLLSRAKVYVVTTEGKNLTYNDVITNLTYMVTTQRYRQCCGSESGIRCLCPLDPGWVKNLDPDPGWTTRIIFPRAQKQLFWVKIHKFFDADSGSGMEKYRIRDGKISVQKSEKNIPDPQH